MTHKLKLYVILMYIRAYKNMDCIAPVMWRWRMACCTAENMDHVV